MAEQTFTVAQLAECAEREVKQRRRVYPRRVKDQRMTQAFADEQIALMTEIARRLRSEADAEAANGDLFGGAA